jgi:hypothetical protein
MRCGQEDALMVFAGFEELLMVAVALSLRCGWRSRSL